MSDKLREAAQRTLETLEDVFGKNKIDVGAINMLRAALAEPAIKESLTVAEQEPVAVDCCANCLRPKNEHQGIVCPKPYTTNWNAWDYPFAPDTTPPQREWVSLTDEEITQGNRDSLVDLWAWESAVLWAEAKLREKNT